MDAGVTTTYTWNAGNQLTGISRTGLTASFTYDSFGRRTGKTINGTTTNFLYGVLNPVQEKNGGTVTANLLTGLGIDEFFTRTDSVGVRALLPDVLGSTVALSDNTGALQTQYTYEPFGVTTQTGATSTSSYKYTGREDDGTELYYYGARYYQPRFQRFVSEDPIEYAGGINLYAYVGNNPVLKRDALGLANGPANSWLNPDPPCSCPCVPPAPAGVSCPSNIAQAQQSYNPFWFFSQVRGSGPWGHQLGPGYLDFGNFNYGATGSAFGFSPTVLYWAAGVQSQIAHGFQTPDYWGKPWSGSPHGDDPYDQYWIQQGIQYYRCGCYKSPYK